jgi:hypothetical protein
MRPSQGGPRRAESSTPAGLFIVLRRLSNYLRRCFRPAPIRSTRVFFMPYTVLLLEFGDALLQPDEISDDDHVRQHRPQRRQPDRLRPGLLGKLGDMVGCPGSPSGHSSDGLVEVAAAIRLNLGSDLGEKWRGMALLRRPEAPFFRNMSTVL